jgi:hypothetical protein
MSANEGAISVRFHLPKLSSPFITYQYKIQEKSLSSDLNEINLFSI